MVSVLSDLNSTSKCINHPGEHIHILVIQPRYEHESCLSSSSKTVSVETVFQDEYLDCVFSPTPIYVYAKISAVNIENLYIYNSKSNWDKWHNKCFPICCFLTYLQFCPQKPFHKDVVSFLCLYYACIHASENNLDNFFVALLKTK